MEVYLYKQNEYVIRKDDSLYIKQIITYVRHNKKQTLIDIKNFLFKISFLVLLLFTIGSKININQQELQIKRLKEDQKSYIKKEKVKIEGYNSEINKYNVKIKSVEKANQDLSNKNKQLEDDKEKLNSQIDKLKEENSNFKAKRKEVNQKNPVSSEFQKDDITVKDEFYSKDEIKKEKVESETNDTYLGEYEITFYTNNKSSTGKSVGDPDYGITSSGARTKAGVTIACPPSIPSGTQLEIEGIGIRKCEDVGGAIKGNRLDIYVTSDAEAMRLGRQHKKVYKVN